MLTILDKLSTWDSARPYGTWRDTLVLNRCRDRIRRNQAHGRALRKSAEGQGARSTPDAQHGLEQDEVRRVMRESLAELTLREGEVFVLRELEAPESGGDLDHADKRTQAAVGWMQQAWAGMDQPGVQLPAHRAWIRRAQKRWIRHASRCCWPLSSKV